MNAHGICAQRFHFLKIAGNGVPLFFPIVFQEAIGAVVIIVETPRRELQTRTRKDEVFAIVADTDELLPPNRQRLSSWFDSAARKKDQQADQEAHGRIQLLFFITPKSSGSEPGHSPK